MKPLSVKISQSTSFIFPTMFSSCGEDCVRALYFYHSEAFYYDSFLSGPGCHNSPIDFMCEFLYEPMVHDYCVFSHCICWGGGRGVRLGVARCVFNEKEIYFGVGKEFVLKNNSDQ